jgi:hypothetical protein
MRSGANWRLVMADKEVEMTDREKMIFNEKVKATTIFYNNLILVVFSVVTLGGVFRSAVAGISLTQSLCVSALMLTVGFLLLVLFHHWIMKNLDKLK